MLLNLHVKNVALIREAEVDFGPGLNILTGETGAGKSIIIGSVNLALGTGNFRDYVPEGENDALVELVFQTDSENVLRMLEEAGIAQEDGQVILTRKYHNGKSISRVNSESVPIRFVRELAGELIDIHGQHEHQSLLYPKFHLQLLDRYAADALGELPAAYREAHRVFSALKKEQAAAITDEKERAKQADLIAYELREIEQAHLTVGEDEVLESEFRRMENAQKITSALQEALQLLEAGDGAGDAVSRAVRSLSGAASYDPQLEPLLEELAQIEDLLSGFGRDLDAYLDDFTYDEQSFYETAQRLDLINHLKTKYGSSIEDILSYRDEQQRKLDRLTDYESWLQDLSERCKQAEENLLDTAGKIRDVRKEKAAVLQKQITEALEDLNFADVRFEISFAPLTEPGADGMDAVCFMISTNPGVPLRCLQDTASGGELSRIMLALKSVMADQDEAGTLIFDEIDSGISGRTAQKVSEKMNVIAARHQVLCITHLAQIAAMADRHYVIEKEVEQGQTQTRIRRIDDQESVVELARILGGAAITDTVMQSAQEMKALAADIKNR